MADPLQQPTAGALPAYKPDFEPVGLQRLAYPLEIGRGLHVEVCGQKSDAGSGRYRGEIVSSRRLAPGSHLVQHVIRWGAESIIERQPHANGCTDSVLQAHRVYVNKER